MSEMSTVFGEFKKSNVFGINEFYMKCQRDRRLAVWIEKRRTLSNLFWDAESIPVEWVLAIVHCKREAQILDQLWKTFIRVGGRATFLGTFGTGSVSDLPIGCARQLATVFFKIFDEECRQTQNLVRHG